MKQQGAGLEPSTFEVRRAIDCAAESISGVRTLLPPFKERVLALACDSTSYTLTSRGYKV